MRLLLWPTVVISLSLTSIIWLTQALRYIDFIINRGLSISDFLYLTMLLLPSLLFLILPIGLFIAVLFVLNKLISESELVVMHASGLSYWQVLRPIVTFGMILMLICYGLSFYLMPLTKRQFKDLQNFLRDNYSSVLLQEEVFNSPVDGLTVFIRSRDKNGILKGILVHDTRAPEQAITMMAEEARLVQTPSGPQFHLINGMRQEKREGRLSWLNFDYYNLDISYYTKAAEAREKGSDEMSFGELLEKRREGKMSDPKMDAEFHQRILWPPYALGLALFGAAVLLRGEFNRRGQWRRTGLASLGVVCIVLASFGMNNVIVKNPLLTPVAYGMITLLILGSLYYIFAPLRQTFFSPRSVSA